MAKRNQLCPCGSNLKYKKCCGSTQKVEQTISPGEKEVLLKLFNSKQMLKTEQACRELLQAYPQSAYLFNLLGITLKEQNKLREAEQAFERATQIKSGYAAAYCNRGIALRYLGQLDKAFQAMETAVGHDPGDSHISDSLISFLNYYVPNIETASPYIKVQESLRQVVSEETGAAGLTDEMVRQLYQQCHNILARNNLLAIYTNKNQLYRGAWPPNDCARHKMVFDAFNIIPAHCFDCYKVTFEPRTVMELIKLLLLFDKLKLANNNERKCIVETRAEMAGTYKGFIYCRSLDEGREILGLVQPIVAKMISAGIPGFVKRGCSEFPLAYPGYGHIPQNKSQLMSYNEEWREHEAYVDKNMATQKYDNPNDFAHDHTGFTLLDVLVIRNWLGFAAKRGDLSYLQIVE